VIGATLACPSTQLGRGRWTSMRGFLGEGSRREQQILDLV
jgi:hypothetical protein